MLMGHRRVLLHGEVLQGHKAVVCMQGPLGGCGEGGGKNACKQSWNLYQLIP